MKNKYDWHKIRELYAQGVSVRKIAEKYGMSISTIARRSKKEDWESLRTKQAIKQANKTMSKIAGQREKDRVALMDAARDILRRIVDGLAGLEMKDLRSAAAALKDIKDVLGVRFELDVEEQKARIENLKKQNEEEDKNITVTISAQADDYAR